MGYDKSIHEAVIEKLQKRRAEAEQTVEKRKKQIYGIIPRIEEIDRALAAININLINDILNSKAGKNKVRQYKKQSIDLQAEKAELLASNGFPIDYIIVRYRCPKCKDKGFIGPDRCSCFEAEFKKELYYRSNLGSMLSHQTFESFNINYYSDDVNKKYSISPRENMEFILKYCKDYIENFSKGSSNLLFTGDTGLGKTFMSSCIAKEIINKGFGVIYDSVHNIITVLENERFNRDTGGIDPKTYYETDLLIMDDLGAEFNTQFSEAALYNLLNSRLIAHKPIIISTNLSPEELNSTYHSRIVSRLGGEFEFLPFFGNDLRKVVTERKKKKRTT